MTWEFDGCCTRKEGHEGPCEWLCSDCNGASRCLDCDGHGCGECDDTGDCLYCTDGYVLDDRPVS
jgi:hypothetical protein